MKIFLLVIVFAGIGMFEGPGLIRKKQRRDLIVFFVFLLLAFGLSLLLTLGVDIPSPLKAIETIF